MTHSDGTIFYDERLQKWRGQIILGRNSSGKTIRKSVSGKNKTEVKKKFRELLADNPNLDILSTDYTVADWLDVWLETFSKPKVEEQSYLLNKRLVDLHLKPNLGHYKLNTLTKLEIQIGYNKMFGDRNKLSQATARAIANRLKQALRKAVELNYLEKNPADGVELPKVRPPRKIKSMTVDEQKIMVETWKKDLKWNNIFLFLLATGLRVSEVTGLTWDYVDLEERKIDVKRIMVEIKGNPKFKEYPKTDSGIRTVYLNSQAVECLEFQKSLLDEDINHLNLVFPNSNYNFNGTANLRRRLEKTFNKAGIQRYNLHALRHTYATRCVEKGANIKFLQHSLGHKNVETTLQIYSDVLTDFQRSQTEAIDIFSN